MKSNEVDFAAQLREAMGEMTQAQLAVLSGLSQPAISKLLTGVTEPSYKTTILLERKLPRLRELRLKETA